MERPSFTRPETEVEVEEKKAYGTSTSVDHSSGEFLDAKDNIGKAGDGLTEIPPPYFHDIEAPIGEGEIGALETAEDIVTTVIHVDDDPTINPWTFRMFFIACMVSFCTGRQRLTNHMHSTRYANY
jgi:hypothetical protein